MPVVKAESVLTTEVIPYLIFARVKELLLRQWINWAK